MIFKSHFYGWKIVAICTVSMTLGYGVRHSFSVFYPHILEEFSESHGSTALILSIHLFVYGIVCPFIGTLTDHWKPKNTITFGAIILGISTSSCSISTEIWHFYLIFGFFTPIGLACVGSPVVTPTIINWFKKSRGLAYGIAQMGGGLSFIFAIYAELLINLIEWRYAYIVLGLTIMILLIPLILVFFAGNPSEKNLKPYDYDKEILMTNNFSHEISSENRTLWEALRTHQLWFMAISQTLFWGPGCYMILALQIKFAQEIGYDNLFAASIFGLFGVTMVLGQVSASISDLVGREWVLVIACILCIASVFALTNVNDTSKNWLLYVYALGFGYGTGLHAPTVLLGASDLFAGKHFGAITGMIIGFAGVAGSLGPWFGGFLFDKYGNYKIVFEYAILSFVFSAIFFILSAPRRKNIAKHFIKI